MSQPWRSPSDTWLSDEDGEPRQHERRHHKHDNGELAIRKSRTQGRSHSVVDVKASSSASTSSRTRPGVVGHKAREPEITAFNGTRTGTRNTEASPKSGVRTDSITLTRRDAASPQEVTLQRVSSGSKGKQTAKTAYSAATTVAAFDAPSGVKSVAAVGPPSQITAPDLQRQGIFVHKSLEETRRIARGTGAGEEAIARYKIDKKPREVFRFGNVIEFQWVEPDTGSTTTITHRNGDVGRSRLRRFVVIREGQEHAAILPICRYGGRGVGSSHEIREHHAIIYTGTMVPSPLPIEEPIRTEAGVDSLLRPIRVIPEDRAQRLDETSRLNFAKVYQITHARCEVRVFGRVAEESTNYLLYQFQAVQQRLGGPSERSRSDGTSARRQYRRAAEDTGRVSHERIDSAQLEQDAAPYDAQKSREEADDDDENDANEENRNDVRRIDPGQPTQHSIATQVTPAALTQYLGALHLRPDQVGVDLPPPSAQQQLNMTQMNAADQTRYILTLLQQHDVPRYTQVVQNVRHRIIRRRAEQSTTEADSGDDTSSEEGSDDNSE